MNRTAVLLVAVIALCITMYINAQAPPAARPATTTNPQVTFIRDYVPLDCGTAIQNNYLVTFHYAAHLVTKDRRVGELFDETADYAPITLHANSRDMLPPLANGMLGACIDERRTIVIPYQFAQFESIPKDTDIVFLVHIIGVAPNQDIFDLMDTDNSGCVDLGEMTAYVKSTGRVVDSLVEATGKRLFNLNDLNGDGVIECKELSGQTLKNCDIVETCLKTKDELDKFLEEFVFDENHVEHDWD